jgi:hypothetical protein
VFEAEQYNVASSIFRVDQNGVVTLYDQRNLRIHEAFTYVLPVVCYDSAYPDVQDRTTVNIVVNRNVNAPIFSLPRYTAVIPESYPPGSQVVCVNATDADGDYIYFSITGDVQSINNARVNALYFLDQVSRCIYLKGDLTAYSQLEDNIALSACDGLGTQRRCGSSVAVITITRDRFPPFFTNTPYFTTVNALTADIGDSVLLTSAQDPDLVGAINFETLDSPARFYFGVNLTTGRIFVKNDLLRDVSQQYLLGLKAYDTAYPATSATVTATINMIRNQSSP